MVKIRDKVGREKAGVNKKARPETKNKVNAKKFGRKTLKLKPVPLL
jgi:hypothetical protein